MTNQAGIEQEQAPRSFVDTEPMSISELEQLSASDITGGWCPACYDRDPGRLMTTDEVALALRIPVEQVTNIAWGGALSCYALGEKTLRFSARHVRDYLNSVQLCTCPAGR